MSARKLPTSGRALEALLRGVLDDLTRIKNGGAIKGPISLNDTIRIGGVNVVAAADGSTIEFVDAATGQVIHPVDPTPPAPGPITGQINADGTTAAGTGFASSSGGTGLYTITFTTPFAAAPTVVATAFDSTGSRVAHIVSVSTTSAVIQIRQGGGTVNDMSFHFVAFTTA